MSNKSYLDYAGLKRVLKRLLPGNRKIWHGSWEDWEQLSAAEKAEYDQAELTLGSFEQENLAIDTVVASTTNMVESNAVNTKYNRFKSYNSSTYSNGTGSSWANFDVNIPNVEKGKYLVMCTIQTNYVGIISIAAGSTGVYRNIGELSNSSWTGDEYTTKGIVGFYEQTADGNANLKASIYYSGTGSSSKGQVFLVKIG